ncbi:TIGR03617 family F420-dependent LLM class oxidoreductase [Sinobacterium caligoides]|nr:TIGR03617 family F420-dependent LLM class oxidoreductase [Sinobacterium caligoides]
MFQLYATTPERMSPAEIGRHAQRAEAMGFTGLHVPDAIHDGLLLANNALLATTRLRVGTAVLLAFPRSPMTVAVAAWGLQAMSAGRFELGLGSQIKQNMEQRYSVPWTAPVPRMREYIQALQAIFHSFQTGERLSFEGEHYRFTRLQPFFNPGPIDQPEIEISMGAIGPKMTQLAARVADGMITHPTNTPPRYLREVCLPRLERGAQLGDRSLAAFKLTLGGIVAVGRDDAAVQQQREKQRQLLAFLYSTPAYWPSLELFGWQERGEQLLQCTRAGDWQQMARLVDDEMLDTFVPSGRYEQLAEVIRSRYAGLATRLTLPLPEDPADDEVMRELVQQLQS